MEILVWLLVIFVAVAVAVIALGSAWEQRSDRASQVRRRLTALQTAARRGASEEVDLLRDELLSEIPALNRILASWQRSWRLQRLLAQADIGMRPGKFLLVCACAGAVGLVLVLSFSGSLLLGSVVAIVTALSPIGYARFRRARRFAKFESMFPEAIELLVRATRAGHPFTSALELIANELGEPISGEFRQVFEEQKFGLPIREALLNLTDRVPLLDVKFFVTSILLQRETGGNLAEILEKLAHVIRERFKIRRQVRVYTAQGRLTMGLLMVLPPAVIVMITLIDPDLMKLLFVDKLGNLMLAVAIVLQVIGFFLLRRIIDIKV